MAKNTSASEESKQELTGVYLKEGIFYKGIVESESFNEDKFNISIVDNTFVLIASKKPDIRNTILVPLSNVKNLAVK